MFRNRLSLIAASLLAIAAASGTQLPAQQTEGGAAAAKPRKAEPAPEMFVRVYRVDDLVLPSSNYPFHGTSLPGMASDRAPGRAMSGMGMMGGGMMGGGMTPGGMGPGGSPPSQRGSGGESRERSSGHGMTMGGLMNAIQSLISPQDWDDVGGYGDLTTLGGSLVVRQSAANQEKVLRFIEDLRQEVGAIRTVTVRAHWLSLSSPELDQLMDEVQAHEDNVVDRQALREFAEGSAPHERYRGQITCFNGQTVHLVSGRLRSVVQGGMPVVGGSGVGYQPLTSTPHIGAMLQVTPSLLPGGEAAVVDLQSTVTRWDLTAAGSYSYVPVAPAHGDNADDADLEDTKKPPRRRRPTGDGAGKGMGAMPTMPGPGGVMPMMQGMVGGMMPNAAPKKPDESSPVPIDRVNIVAQQLATSLRVPLNRPVLVGGMTFPGVEGSPASDEQLYLVLEVTAQSDTSAGGTPRSERKKGPAER
ncbi:MAG TPA: hypothetical protein VFW87_01680 [Pirellulales bacterium]|nr:hypothetical protein [Pirellulales bacterium]